MLRWWYFSRNNVVKDFNTRSKSLNSGIWKAISFNFLSEYITVSWGKTIEDGTVETSVKI